MDEAAIEGHVGSYAQMLHWVGTPTDIADDVLAELATVLLRRGRGRTAALVAGVEAIRFQWTNPDTPATSARVQLFCDSFLPEMISATAEADLVCALKALLARRGVHLESVAIIATPPMPQLG